MTFGRLAFVFTVGLALSASSYAGFQKHRPGQVPKQLQYLQQTKQILVKQQLAQMKQAQLFQQKVQQ